jgi:hypothetical protein
MGKRCATVYTFFKKKLREHSEPYYLITYSDLKCYLGQTIHVPKEDVWVVIKDLVSHEILDPTSEKQWKEFRVL